MSVKKHWVDPNDAPELTGKELFRPDGKWKIGGKEVSPEEGRIAFREELGKTQVNMWLDNLTIKFFKRKSGGRGYQTLINQALRESIERETFEEMFRRVIREELKTKKRKAA